MLGSLLLTNLSDLYGRKPVVICSTAVSSLLIIPIIFCQTAYKSTLVATLLFGMMGACKYSVSYMYSVELSTSINSNYFGLMCLVGDSLSSVLLGIYFIFFKSFNVSLWFLLVTQLLSIYILYQYVPESPRYLLTIDDKNAFIQAILSIATWNKQFIDEQ